MSQSNLWGWIGWNSCVFLHKSFLVPSLPTSHYLGGSQMCNAPSGSDFPSVLIVICPNLRWRKDWPKHDILFLSILYRDWRAKDLELASKVLPDRKLTFSRIVIFELFHCGCFLRSCLTDENFIFGADFTSLISWKDLICHLYTFNLQLDPLLHKYNLDTGQNQFFIQTNLLHWASPVAGLSCYPGLANAQSPRRRQKFERGKQSEKGESSPNFGSVILNWFARADKTKETKPCSTMLLSSR